MIIITFHKGQHLGGKEEGSIYREGGREGGREGKRERWREGGTEGEEGGGMIIRSKRIK